MRALGDAALVAAMRDGDAWAWGEFVARFQPRLDAFAQRVGIPDGERAECVEDVLADEALRFTRRGATPRLPGNLSAYLMRAVRHKYLRVRRSQSRRSAHYAEAAATGGEDDAAEYVVRSACSAHALRHVSEAEADGGESARGDHGVLTVALARLTSALRGALTADEERLLVWHGEQVPHREIAAWLGVSYDAATKRVWRLCRRLQALAAEVVRDFPPEEREALARRFRRAGMVQTRGEAGEHWEEIER